MNRLPSILASCWTTAGDVGPMSEDQRSPFALEDRIAAAASAGYTGFGIVHADLVTAKANLGYTALAEMFDRYGIAHIEVEMLNDWYTTGPARAASDAVRRDLLEAAAALHARHIKVGGDISSSPVDWELFVSEFAALCAQAAQHGTRIAFEPMPFGNVADLVTARRLIDQAGEPVGGLLLDLWHMARAGIGNSSIAALPRGYVIAAELDDAAETVAGTLLEDTLYRRRLCGEGSQDVTGFIRAVRATGFSGPWGVEILSAEFRRLDLRAQVTRSYRTTAHALRRAAPSGFLAD
jgi:sugar phosphate isomerase/epimerase